jgi:Colicin V production protein.
MADWMILDILAVLVISFNIYICARRGFVSSLLGLCACVIGWLAAKHYSPVIAQLLYDNAVGQMLQSWVQQSMTAAIQQSGQGLDAMPVWIQLVFSMVSSSNLDIIPSADAMMMAAVQQPVMWMLEGVCFWLLFMLVSFAFRLISRLFSDLYKLPVVGEINTFLGGVIGVVQAVVLLLVIAFILGVIIIWSSNQLLLLNRETLEATYVLRVFFRFIFPY